MKEEQEISLTPLDNIAGRNGLQIIKAFLPYMNRPAQMPLAFLVKFLELQNLRMFFQERGSLAAQNLSSHFESPMEIISEVIPYFPVAMREQIQQGLQMMEMLKTVQDLNAGYENFDILQSMFTQPDFGKETT